MNQSKQHEEIFEFQFLLQVMQSLQFSLKASLFREIWSTGQSHKIHFRHCRPLVVMILVEFGKHWQYHKQIQITFWWWDEQACLVHYAERSENVPQVNAKPPADAGLLGDIINLVFRYFSLGFQKYLSLGFNKYLWSNIFWFAFRGDPYEGVSSDTSLKRDYRSSFIKAHLYLSFLKILTPSSCLGKPRSLGPKVTAGAYKGGALSLSSMCHFFIVRDRQIYWEILIVPFQYAILPMEESSMVSDIDANIDKYIGEYCWMSDHCQILRYWCFSSAAHLPLVCVCAVCSRPLGDARDIWPQILISKETQSKQGAYKCTSVY